MFIALLSHVFQKSANPNPRPSFILILPLTFLMEISRASDWDKNQHDTKEACVARWRNLATLTEETPISRNKEAYIELADKVRDVADAVEQSDSNEIVLVDRQSWNYIIENRTKFKAARYFHMQAWARECGRVRAQAQKDDAKTTFSKVVTMDNQPYRQRVTRLEDRSRPLAAFAFKLASHHFDQMFAFRAA